ncbi:uncharacterized protein BDZ99DRAFT_556429 [Mytilinidion resinicola]|uniref:Rhodopsin domain-containing protein n=1 Tax=Mytilinidion resinicola TaxID=574789 RepID=A0A6A6YWD7_9PEZI|nr:uncharacterized protein BDZ99DRAFT_556429 [Mytilinidion resinicola]KAF2813111.1 hypothetical protein BDZ99DRAFT_556429 [Mytilinidion resinicola]
MDLWSDFGQDFHLNRPPLSLPSQTPPSFTAVINVKLQQHEYGDGPHQSECSSFLSVTAGMIRTFRRQDQLRARLRPSNHFLSLLHAKWSIEVRPAVANPRGRLDHLLGAVVGPLLGNPCPTCPSIFRGGARTICQNTAHETPWALSLDSDPGLRVIMATMRLFVSNPLLIVSSLRFPCLTQHGGPRGMGPTVVAVTLLEMFLALAFVVARTWARIKLFSGMRADGYWLLRMGSDAFTAVAIAGAYRGLGQRNDKLTDVEEIKKLSKLFFTYAGIFPISIATSKAAVATFLLIILVKKKHKIILYTSMSIIALLCLLEFIGLFIQCFPVYSNWNPFITDKVCKFNVTAVGYTLAGYSTFLDFFLAALPWFFLRSLQIKRRERLTINISLSAGVFAGICGIIRLQQLVALEAATDRNYQFAATVIWSSTEFTVSIICTCFPATRTLYRRYVKCLTSSTGDSTTSRSGSRRARNTGNMYTLNDRSVNGNGVTVTGGATSMGGGIGGVGGRNKANGSDESILGDEFRMQNVHGIKQTTNVVVEFEDWDGDTRKVKDGETDKSVEVV